MTTVAKPTATGDEPHKAGHPCASCDGRLLGHERGWVCDPCVWDWERWHRNERESNARWVERMVTAGIGDVARGR